MNENVKFRDWEAEQMKDPVFRLLCILYEPVYQWARLRYWLDKRRYRKQIDEWARAYDRECIKFTKEEFDALYDDSFFEAMDMCE